MQLKEQIQDDLKAAMKAKDTLRTSTIRMLRAEILKKENEKPGAKVDDPIVHSLIHTLIKQRKDAAEQYEKGGRPELAEKETAEIIILEAYLPEMISEEEIKDAITEVIAETGAATIRDMGKVMGLVMKRLKETGKTVDGKLVNTLVKSALSEQK